MQTTPEARVDPPSGNQAIRRAEDIHQQFIDHGAGDKPFWITEIGWSTCTEASTDYVSEAQQATDMTTLFGHIHGGWKGWIQAAFFYRYDDGAKPATVQDAYGLIHLDGSAKPALAIFRNEAALSS